MAVPRVRWARATASTSSDTTDITVSGITDDCQGAIVFINGPYTDNSTVEPGRVSIGFLNITGDTTAEEMCICAFAESQVSPENSGRRGNNAVIGMMLSVTGGTIFLSDYCDFTTRITGGFRITWNGGGTGNEAGAAYKIDALMFFGDAADYQMDIGEDITSASLNGTSTTTLPTAFSDTPEFVFAMSQDRSLDNTTVDNWITTFGFASIEGGSSTILQGGHGRMFEDGGTTRDAGSIIDDRYTLSFADCDGTVRGAVELTDAGAGSLEWTKRIATGAIRFAYFAISTGGQMDTHVSTYLPATSTGNDSYNFETGVTNFTPQAYLWISCRTDSGGENTIDTGATAQNWSRGGADIAGNVTNSGACARTTATQPTFGYGGGSSPFRVRNHTGTTRFSATHVSMDSDGFTVNIVDAPANPTFIRVMLFERLFDYPRGWLEHDTRRRRQATLKRM